MATRAGYRQLDVGVIGGGIGGQAVAIALRRQGHKVTIYEQRDFSGEVGASISCAVNGSRWLHTWEVDIARGDPVILKKLISHDWETGKEISVYDLGDYKEKWGWHYYMFHRQYMHSMLKHSALAEEGAGLPAQLEVNHKAEHIDLEKGEITFANGKTVKHDVVIGADGIGSVTRKILGIIPDKRPATCICLHTNVDAEKAVAQGLVDYNRNSAIEYWGGHDDSYVYQSHWRIVLSPCNGGKLESYYCFSPREASDVRAQSWHETATLDQLLKPYPTLDRQVYNHLALGYEIRPWRLWIHEPYPTWHQGVTALIGDAAHPMMPDQSQGACQSIEDAAAIGEVFSRSNFDGNVQAALDVYEQVRKPRATRVQAGSARARENINERIGFSSNTDVGTYHVKDENQKLTIEEVNGYDLRAHIKEVLAERRGEAVPEKRIDSSHGANGNTVPVSA